MALDYSLFVECVEESELEISSEFCTIHIPEQTPGGGVHYVNGPYDNTVTVEVTIEETKFTTEGFFCPDGVAGLNAKVLIECLEDTGSPFTGTAATTPTGIKEGNTVYCFHECALG